MTAAGLSAGRPLSAYRRATAVARGRVAGQAVDRVGGKDGDAARRRCSPRTPRRVEAHRVPTTTRSIPARSRRACTSPKPPARMQLRDRRRLPLPQLDRQQPRAARCGRGGHEPADDVEPVLAGEQRAGRLVAGDLGRERRALALGDVGRVGEHGVAPRRTPASRSPSWNVDAVEPEPRARWRARRRARRRSTSVPMHLEVRALVRERQRDRAAAGPDVDDARALRQQLEADLDEQLGLRPRHEHARVDARGRGGESRAAR